MQSRDYTPEQIEAAFAAVTVGIHRMVDQFNAAAAAFAAWYESLPPDVRTTITGLAQSSRGERPIHLTPAEEAEEVERRR